MYFARFKIKKEWIYYYLCPTWTYAFRLYLQLCTCSSRFMINSTTLLPMKFAVKLLLQSMIPFTNHYSIYLTWDLMSQDDKRCGVQRMTLQCIPSYMRAACETGVHRTSSCYSKLKSTYNTIFVSSKLSKEFTE